MLWNMHMTFVVATGRREPKKASSAFSHDVDNPPGRDAAVSSRFRGHGATTSTFFSSNAVCF